MTAVFAHRGATGHFAENTVGAFVEARELGCDGVELDVRRSADGALVVHHDAGIEGLGPIVDLTVAELPPSVPLLAEALDACQGMIVNVEIKNSPGEPGHDPREAVSRAAVTTIVETGWGERVIVSSFSRASIDAVRTADPTIPVGWLLEWTADGEACVTQGQRAGYDAIHPFVTQVDAALVEAAHEAGMEVNVWTVNAAHDLATMGSLGVDAVITDRPETALSILGGA